MPESDYLGQEDFLVSVLPARVAYLIRSNSRSGYIRAVQEASTRWGGVTEPIVPVRSDGRINPAWRQIVEFANLDGAVNVDLSVEAARIAAGTLALPLTQIARIDADGAGRFTCHPRALEATDGSVPPFGAAWEAIGAGWTYADDGQDLWAITAAGCLTPETAQALRDVGDPSAIVQNPGQIALAQIGSRTGLSRTELQFRERWASPPPFPMPSLIWLCDRRTALTDCLSFWNRRALRSLGFARSPMVVLPAYEVDTWPMFAQHIQAMLAGRPDEFSPDAYISSRRVDEDRLRALADSWGLIESTMPTRAQSKYPPPAPRLPPFSFLLNKDPRAGLLWRRRYGVSTNVAAQVFRKRTTIRFDSPVTFNGPSLFKLNTNSEVFRPLPRRDSIARLVSPSAHWRDDGLEYYLQSFSTRCQVEFRIPSLDEVVSTLLGGTTSAWSPSDKGRLGQGIDSIAADQLLLRPGVLEAIEDLRTRRSTQLLKELERRKHTKEELDRARFVSEFGGRLERQSQAAKDLHVAKDQSVEIAEALVAVDWAERGYRLTCERCSVTSFVDLEHVTPTANCPGCRSQQSYVRSDDSLTVYYRLSTLIDLASDQGVLPHLVAVAALRREAAATDVIPGVNVQFADSTQEEVDLFGVHDGKVVAGEVKTSAADFTPRQLNRDISLSKRLGADLHVMACVEAIPEATAAQASEIASKSGLAVKILDFTAIRV